MANTGSRKLARPPNPVTEPTFARFNNWIEEYFATQQSNGVNKEVLATGVELAQQRRDDLYDLIQADPARALELRLPTTVSSALPDVIKPLLEKPISGRGDLAVLAALPKPGRESEVKPLFRTVTLGDQTYQAFVYGRRIGEPTRLQIPLHGIAVEDVMAVAENPIRWLAAAEANALEEDAAQPHACGYCIQTIDGDEESLVGEVAQEKVWACSADHANRLDEQYIAAEAGGDQAGNVAPSSIQPASAHTEGVKKLLFIRVDFSDRPGDPFSESIISSLVSNVNQFYRESSYGKAGFAPYQAGSDLTPTFRMPRTAAYYGTNDFFSRLRSDARNAAAATGYTLSDYNFDLICFGNVPGWSWLGLGYIGVAGLWLQGREAFTTGVVAHELGHNFGLPHANFWNTSGQSVIGKGTSTEYGDQFDTMGSAAAGVKHFNARFKNHLNWMGANEVVTATTNGLYRIYPHDVTNAAPGMRALKIAHNRGTNYWVEFRQRYTSNKWLMSGISLRWAPPGTGIQPTLLLDTTPGSLDAKDDSGIVLGRTYSDGDQSIHITPVALGGTTPQSILVAVNRGPFTNNSAPTITVAVSTARVSANQSITLTATATDPDGDALAYSWDMGDRNFGVNAPSLPYRWAVNGTYLVRCFASDMKGGTASASVVVQVGTPTTYTLSGQVIMEGQPLAGVRIFVSSSRSTITDADGTYKLVGLSRGVYTVNAQLEGYHFTHPGFSNPVQVQSDTARIDFNAVTLDVPIFTTLVTDGSVWRYQDDGSDQGESWRQPEFDDSAWKEGAAKFGYGDADVTTRVEYGPNSSRKYVTTYFRHPFTITTPEQYGGLTAFLLRDDGAVVYLNGVEVFRSNMPGGVIRYNTFASGATGGTDERAFFESNIDSTLLKPGRNVLAVEVHQSSFSSSDLGFDFELRAIQAAALTVSPRLTWEPLGQYLKLSWPAPSEGWELYSAAGLSGSTWERAGLQTRTSNGQKSVLILLSEESHKFYRLRK